MELIFFFSLIPFYLFKQYRFAGVILTGPYFIYLSKIHQIFLSANDADFNLAIFFLGIGFIAYSALIGIKKSSPHFRQTFPGFKWIIH